MQIEIPGYRIIRVLGKGGMASVYLAIQESFGREVALKIMSPDLSKDATFGDRFLHEARIVSRLVHPNIVTVYDVGIHDGYYFLSMEYVPGQDLTRKRYELSLINNLMVVKDIASALDFAGKKGYVHRDVKPENIMLHEDSGRAVLMDFGIARISDTASGMTQTGMAIGTPHYMSPEQAKGQTVDARADLYSLGVVLFLLLTGRVPYHADSAVVVGIMHVSEDIPRLPGPLQIFQPIIDRVLAKNPAERYQTGADLIADLDAITMRDIVAAEQGYAHELADIVVRETGGTGFSVPPAGFEKTSLDAVPATASAATMLTPRAITPHAFTVAVQADHPDVLSSHPHRTSGIETLAVSAEDRVGRHHTDEEKTSGHSYLLLILILVLAVGGFYFLTETQRIPRTDSGISAKVSDESPAQSAAANISSAEAIAEPLPLSLIVQAQDLRAQINEDVAQAPELAALYRQALNSSDLFEQQAAREGLEDLQYFYAAQITAAIAAPDMERAAELAESAIAIFAQEERINALQEVLAYKDHDDKIAKQLQQAEGYFAQDALTSPAGSNALELYQAVLQDDPQNPLAQNGIEKIARRYGELAAVQQENGNIAQALNSIDQGLAVTAGNTDLLQQRQDLEALQQAQQKQQAAENSILEKAKTLQAAGKLVAPRGDNALETYQALLAQNAQHSAALKGVAAVERLLAQEVKTLIQNEEFSVATSKLAIARESFPHSKMLLALNVELDQAISAIMPAVTYLSVTSEEVNQLVDPQEPAIAADRIIYIGFEYRNFKAETSVIQAILYDGSRSHQIVQVPVVISGAEGTQFFRMEQPVTGFAEGGYSIDLLFDNNLLISTKFSVKKSD